MSLKKKIAACIVAILVCIGAYFGIPSSTTKPVLTAVADAVTAPELPSSATPTK